MNNKILPQKTMTEVYGNLIYEEAENGLRFPERLLVEDMMIALQENLGGDDFELSFTADEAKKLEKHLEAFLEDIVYEASEEAVKIRKDELEWVEVRSSYGN